MDSLGEYLKEQRLKLKVNLNQIAKDTNISIKYLEAIENDEYSAFPGEAYLKGFLRTYCKYIGIDPDEVINKYDRIKIAETPTPIEKLIPKPQASLKKLLIIAGIVIAPIMLISLVVVIGKSFSRQISERKITEKKAIEKKIFEILEPGSKVTFDLKENNSIIMNSGNGNVTYKVKRLSKDYVMLSDNNDNDIMLFRDKLKEIDFDNNNVYDAGILLNNWNSDGANITFSLYPTGTTVASNNLQALASIDSEVLYKKPNIEDIKLNIKTRSGTFIRYKADDNNEVETFYNPNIDLKIEAKNRVIVWLSNAGAVTFNLKDMNKAYTPGNAGEVVVKVLEWKKNNSGEFELQIGSLN